MKVTPLSEVPIIPKATKYQGDWRLALKNVCESPLPEVRNEIKKRRAKYPPINNNAVVGDMP